VAAKKPQKKTVVENKKRKTAVPNKTIEKRKKVAPRNIFLHQHYWM
jgi:hypothetical protein